MMKSKFTVAATCLLFSAGLSFAQTVGSNPIPADPEVRKGVLENGMTYIIRQNPKPENKVELRLAVNAGSILEDADQLGLAHFTEHMAFNGSKNFQKNELVSYLQSVGVKFGADLNAYTSFDETVYILPVPTDDEAILDKGLLVLEDWAANLSFDHEEIDKERGVVIEEWRLGRGASQRMRDKYFPLLFKGSQYAERLPIGTLDVLENFDYETIKRYYRDWYRPDMMAVIAIGDIDPDAMEKKIKERFGKIPAAAKKRERKVYDVPGHKETLVSVQRDKEQPFTQVQLMYKHDKKDNKTEADFRRMVVEQLYNGMLNARLNELRQTSAPPFISGFAFYSSLTRTKDAYQSFASVSESGIETGLKTLLTENERVRKFGFTQSELDRQKKEVLVRYERQYNERDKTESRNFASEYVRHFLAGDPVPGIEYVYNFFKQQIPTVTLEEINKLAGEWITDENRVVIVTGPEKDGVEGPSEAQILTWLNEAGKADIKPYEEKAVAASLMEAKPAPGKTTAQKTIESIGVTELILSNGVVVVLKPTDFKNDEILMSAFGLGGTSVYPDEDHFSAQFASQIVSMGGVADFPATELQKMMTGKTVRVSPYIAQTRQGMSGSTTPADLEDMFQLVHLYFTNPRKDPDAFNAFLTNNKALYQNLMSSPQFYFSDKLSKILSQNHPRGGGFPTLEEFDKISLDRAHEIFKDRFADASGFHFFLSGNFEVEQIKPLLETYIGSLPSKNKGETWRDLGIRPPVGPVREVIKKGADQKSQVNIVINGETPYSREDAYRLRCLGEILTIKLIEQLREEKGGVYGVGARGSMAKIPYENFSFNISFPCSPDNAEDLIKAAMAEVEKLRKDGPTEEDLGKIKETQRREMQESIKRNNYWNSALESSYYLESNPEDILTYPERIDKLSGKELQEAAQKFLSNPAIEVALMPEEEAK